MLKPIDLFLISRQLNRAKPLRDPWGAAFIIFAVASAVAGVAMILLITFR